MLSYIKYYLNYIKIKLKRNEGLTAKQKTLGQLIVTVGYTMTLWASHNTVWFIPFLGNVNFEKMEEICLSRTDIFMLALPAKVPYIPLQVFLKNQYWFPSAG